MMGYGGIMNQSNPQSSKFRRYSLLDLFDEQYGHL